MGFPEPPPPSPPLSMYSKRESSVYLMIIQCNHDFDIDAFYNIFAQKHPQRLLHVDVMLRIGNQWVSIKKVFFLMWHAHVL